MRLWRVNPRGRPKLPAGRPEASFTEADTTRRLEALIREALESAEVALEVAE